MTDRRRRLSRKSVEVFRAVEEVLESGVGGTPDDWEEIESSITDLEAMAKRAIKRIGANDPDDDDDDADRAASLAGKAQTEEFVLDDLLEEFDDAGDATERVEVAKFKPVKR